MKAVILSCNTGGGHNAAAKALCEALTQSGHDAQVLDYLVLAGERVSKTVGDSYVELVKHTPKAFGAVYDLGMAVSTASSVPPSTTSTRPWPPRCAGGCPNTRWT